MTLEQQVAQQLADVGAPEDLAPQLVAIAEQYSVPAIALLSWIRQGSPSIITGAAWLAAARVFPEEHKSGAAVKNLPTRRKPAGNSMKGPLL